MKRACFGLVDGILCLLLYLRSYLLEEIDEIKDVSIGLAAEIVQQL
jgi:hypothetical protein